MEGRYGVLGFFAFLVFSVVVAHNGESHEEVGSLNLKYDSCVALTTEYGLKLRWNLDLDNGTVYFAIESKGAGWVGIGISLDGEMSSSGKGSDMIVGWMDNKNTDCGLGCVKDYWASQDAQPQLDPQQDVAFISGEQEDGVTRLEFSRKLKTGDSMDRDFPVNKGFILLWAVGVNPPKSFSQYEEHDAHGMTRIVLSTAYTCTSPASGHMSGHSLFFTASDSVIILFSGWETTNGGEYFGSLLAVIIASFVYETFVIFTPVIVEKFTDGQTKGFTTKQRALSTFLRVIQLALAYLLMLISMTYDVGLFFSLLLGLGVAHACFFHRPWLKQPGKEDEDIVPPPECH